MENPYRKITKQMISREATEAVLADLAKQYAEYSVGNCTPERWNYFLTHIYKPLNDETKTTEIQNNESNRQRDQRLGD